MFDEVRVLLSSFTMLYALQGLGIIEDIFIIQSCLYVTKRKIGSESKPGRYAFFWIYMKHSRSPMFTLYLKKVSDSLTLHCL